MLIYFKIYFVRTNLQRLEKSCCLFARLLDLIVVMLFTTDTVYIQGSLFLEFDNRIKLGDQLR